MESMLRNVDSERIPGVTREWVVGHVRAGRQELILGLDSFAFDFVAELSLVGLKDEWIASFRKP